MTDLQDFLFYCIYTNIYSRIKSHVNQAQLHKIGDVKSALLIMGPLKWAEWAMNELNAQKFGAANIC